MTIGYSKEVLYHFSCGECKKWWTVGDWQGAENDRMHCPHCGTQQTVEPLPPFEPPKTEEA